MVNIKTWFSKQRWHFIYGLIVLCLLAGTIWQRAAMQEQTVLVKALSEHIARDHLGMVQHMHQFHNREPQLKRF